MIGNLKSNRTTWPCLGAVLGSANIDPIADMSPSTRNLAYFDVTECLDVNSATTLTADGRTQLSNAIGYSVGFQTGMWQLAADCTTLSALWLNSDGTTVPVLPAYIPEAGFMGLFGSKTALLATFPEFSFQEVTLQLTPEGYVKVTRAGIADTYYIGTTFNTFLEITTDTAQAQVFRFTTDV
jgi:hypothetical protein